jgi:hypothetical protein
MNLNFVKHLYSNLIEILTKEKNVWSVILRLGKVLKLMLFKKVDMVIIAHGLSKKIQIPDLKDGLAIYPITTHDQITSLNEVVGLSNYKPYGTINWLHEIFSNGGLGYMIIQNDRPIGCYWANENIPANLFPGVRVPLEIGDVYIHTLFVSQLNRFQKIGKTLAYYQLLFLQERGYKRAIATVEKANLAGLKIHKKIGGLTLGELSGFRFLTWSRLNYKWYYYVTRPISPAPETV